MRVALGLLLLTILSTCMVSGTFAKYTTTVTSGDVARVASWGFTETSIDIEGLFEHPFEPGSSGEDSFRFVYDGKNGAPEVKYVFKVLTEGSKVSEAVEINQSIQWKLDDGNWVSFSGLLQAIRTLSGNESGLETYGAGVLPSAFRSNQAHTIYWRWVYTDTRYWAKETVYLADFEENSRYAKRYEQGDYLKEDAYQALTAAGKTKILVSEPSVYYLCQEGIGGADYIAYKGTEYAVGNFLTEEDYLLLTDAGKNKVKIMTQNNLDTYIGEWDLKEVRLSVTIQAKQED